MKKIIGLLVLLSLFGACSSDLPVTVMTFNIRYSTPRDSSNFWEYRKDQVVDLIDQQNCDFVGIQEALPVQIAYLIENLPHYQFISRTRELDSTRGEAVPLIFLKDKWELEKAETFWLSSTPEIPGSNTWNAACNRVATWGIFKSLEGNQRVLVCNAHFDHVSQVARINGAKLIIDRISALAGDLPIVLLGDLNGKPENPAIKVLSSTWYDPYPDFHPGDTINGTFHGFRGNPIGRRIDYIMFHSHKAVESIEIIRSNNNGVYPSDHFPVSSTVIL